MKIFIRSQKEKEVVDVTSRVQEVVGKMGVRNGLCHLYVTHTTAALTVADLDPGTDQDMLEAWEKMLPEIDYRHPHDPAHAPDHILAATLGPEVSVPIEKGELVLGTWQRAVLVEFNGPREREVRVSVVKSI